MNLPEGYQPHPNAPGYMWNPATSDVRPIPTAAPPPSPPAPAVAPTPAPAASPAGYGSLDLGAAEAEHAALQARAQGQFEKTLIIDFPDLPKPVNSESQLIARLLPPWQSGERYAWAKTVRFRLDASLLPKPPEGRSTVYVDSWDATGGPGDCPIAKAIEKLANSGNEEAQKVAKRFKARARVYWQGLDLNDPQKHFQQKKDANGTPLLDANGQPVWIVVPGVIPMGNKLHRRILSFIKEKGDCTHPDHGYPMKLKRIRTGRGDMDIDYDAMDMEKGPIDPSMRGVLANLRDLQKQMLWFRDAEEQHAIAQNILSKYMPATAGYVSNPAGALAPPPSPPSNGLPPGWQPHPTAGYAWHPATNKVELISNLAPPAPPPPPAPAAPAPAAGGYLPPPAAPGLPPGPPAAPAPYGAPVAPPPPVSPPVTPGMPSDAMSPAALENELRGNPGAPPAPPAPPPPPAAPAPPLPPGWDPTTGTPF